MTSSLTTTGTAEQVPPHVLSIAHWADRKCNALSGVLLCEIQASSEAPPELAPEARSDLDVPPGDPARGKSVYEASCRSCHGAVHTGAGRLRDVYPVLPDEPVRSFTGLYQFSKQDIRVSFIEKVRHGGFLGASASTGTCRFTRWRR